MQTFMRYITNIVRW